MKVAVGSDEKTVLTDALVEELRSRGLEVVPFGSVKTNTAYPWPKVGQEVAEALRNHQVDDAIVCCWTGTGVALAANKVPGIRAVLCPDAETARGARKWDHANVLALSLRLTSPVVAKEILDAWFTTPYEPKEEPYVRQVEEIERKYMVVETIRA